MSSELDAMVVKVRDWMIEHTIFERAEHAFFRYLEGYQREAPEEVTLIFSDIRHEHFMIQIAQAICGISWPGGDFCSVEILIPIVYQQKTFGWYSAVFLLSGEFWDDFWRFDDAIKQKIRAVREKEGA